MLIVDIYDVLCNFQNKCMLYLSNFFCVGDNIKG